MKITIPKSKKIVALVSDKGVVMQAWDVTKPNPDAPKAESFPYEFVRNFIGQTLLADVAWGRDMAGVYAAQEIRGAFVGKKPGQIAELSKEQHERLLAVMRAPSAGYSAPIMGCALDFFEAIEKAEP